MNANITKRPLFCLSKLFLIIFFFVSNVVTSQDKANVLEGKWYLEMNHNDIGFSQMVMEFEAGKSGSFEAYTRKGAVKDIIGGWKSFLARTLTNSFKYGSLLRIVNGTYTTKSDTLTFAGVLTSAVGNYNIQGIVSGGEISATLSNKSHQNKGYIKGSRKVPPLPLRDYNALFRETVNLTQDKIYNRELLNTSEWKAFEKDMNNVSAKLQDDIEMMFAFYYYAAKLPVSHYMLLKPQEQDQSGISSQGYKQRVFLEDKGSGTAYIKIASFEGSAAEMDSVFKIIVDRNYSNLIVDLRNNPGGSVDAGMAFATHVADSIFYGGVFLTQKYFNNHKQLPTVAEYDSFPHFTESNYDLLMDGIHNTEGLCLKVIPQEPLYKGRLFILTNGATGSTCEPIVYGFKQRKRATVVGTPTAGAMLAAEMFNLSHGFKIFLPTADYYASDGFRIDKKGVAPDIDTVDKDALQYVMDNIINP